MLYSAKSIANAYLTLANRDGYDLDPMKLQKLLYYANGYYLSDKGDPLIDEYFEAWDMGPVVPSVYHEFKDYRWRPIKRFAYSWDKRANRQVIAPQPLGDKDAEDVIQWVWEHYRDRDALTLSKMTHKKGGPWDLARARMRDSGIRNEPIKTHEIENYFDDLNQS